VGPAGVEPASSPCASITGMLPLHHGPLSGTSPFGVGFFCPLDQPPPVVVSVFYPSRRSTNRIDKPTARFARSNKLRASSTTMLPAPRRRRTPSCRRWRLPRRPSRLVGCVGVVPCSVHLASSYHPLKNKLSFRPSVRQRCAPLIPGKYFPRNAKCIRLLPQPGVPFDLVHWSLDAVDCPRAPPTCRW